MFFSSHHLLKPFPKIQNDALLLYTEAMSNAPSGLSAARLQ